MSIGLFCFLGILSPSAGTGKKLPRLFFSAAYVVRLAVCGLGGAEPRCETLRCFCLCLFVYGSSPLHIRAKQAFRHFIEKICGGRCFFSLAACLKQTKSPVCPQRHTGLSPCVSLCRPRFQAGSSRKYRSVLPFTVISISSTARYVHAAASTPLVFCSPAA